MRDAGGAPCGIEVLVKKAAVDPAFRELLLEGRSRAAEEIALEIAPAEAALLDCLPHAQLAATIARTKVDAKARPAFLGKTAAVMVAALGASAAGCKPYFPELARLSAIKGVTSKISAAHRLLEKERGLASAAEDAKDRRLHERRVRHLEDMLDKEKRMMERARARARRGTKGHRADRP